MAKDLEARVTALEKVVAMTLYGGSAEEAAKKWEEEHLSSHPDPSFNTAEPAAKKPAPAHAKTTLHTK